MAFGQLYYTSCLTGLSGAPGFQFNAASPGIAGDVMRDVEQLTAYQPPRSLTPETSRESLRDAPVNLCYAPGPTTVVAHVEYVGTDYSHRFGNYFAHALVTRSPQADLDGTVPIELWRAPFWTTRPVEHTNLPELAGPLPVGPLGRATIAAFLGDQPASRHLPALLTAADDAVRSGQRRVVLAARNSDEIASWIAALSYLLPPATAAVMSFATYERDPRYSRMHVVGTVLDDAVDLTDRDFEAFHLFDLIGDRISDVPVHPLARVLGALDVAHAASAWRRVARLAAGSERSFDDWLPVVAAALMTWPQGPECARDEPAAVARWLAGHASRLARADVAEIGGAALVQLTVGPAKADDRTIPALDDLARAAESCGAAEFLGQVERRTVDVLLARAKDPDVVLSTPAMPIRTDPVRRHAAEALSANLPVLPAAAGVRLLAWAGAVGVPVNESALRRTGQQTVGPALLLRPADPALRAALAAWPPLCDGVIRYLGMVGREEFDRLVAGLRDGLGELLGSGLATAGPAVRHAATVARVQSGQLDAVSGLEVIVTDPETGRQPPDERLLTLLFPQGPWSPSEASQVLAILGEQRATVDPVVRRLADTVRTEPEPATQARHAEFCGRLAASAVRARLPVDARERVDLYAIAGRWADRLTRNSRDSAELLAGVRKWFTRLPADAQRRSAAVLLSRFGDLGASTRGELIRTLPGLRRAYCGQLSEILGRRDADVPAAVAALSALRHLDGLAASPVTRAAAAELDAVLRRTVGRWSRRQQSRLQECAQLRSAPESAAFVRRWLRQAPPGVLDRIFRGLSGRRGRPAPDNDAAPQRRAL